MSSRRARWHCAAASPLFVIAREEAVETCHGKMSESPGGRYANNQLLALSLSLTSISRTVIIFDWDDTICPSTFVDQFKVDTFSDLPPHVSFPHHIKSCRFEPPFFIQNRRIYENFRVRIFFNVRELGGNTVKSAGFKNI